MTDCKSKYLLFILPVLLVFGSFLLFFGLKDSEKITSAPGPSVRINNTVASVELADEASEQWQGLSDRESLGEQDGMLFVFPDMQKRTFVMRRMHFPLDIIWIRDNKIVGIAKNLAPEGENPKEFYSSPERVNYVLEVNGGFCDKQGIEVGDVVEINNQ